MPRTDALRDSFIFSDSAKDVWETYMVAAERTDGLVFPTIDSAFPNDFPPVGALPQAAITESSSAAPPLPTPVSGDPTSSLGADEDLLPAPALPPVARAGSPSAAPPLPTPVSGDPTSSLGADEDLRLAPALPPVARAGSSSAALPLLPPANDGPMSEIVQNKHLPPKGRKRKRDESFVPAPSKKPKIVQTRISEKDFKDSAYVARFPLQFRKSPSLPKLFLRCFDSVKDVLINRQRFAELCSDVAKSISEVKKMRKKGVDQNKASENLIGMVFDNLKEADWLPKERLEELRPPIEEFCRTVLTPRKVGQVIFSGKRKLKPPIQSVPAQLISEEDVLRKPYFATLPHCLRTRINGTLNLFTRFQSTLSCNLDENQFRDLCEAMSPCFSQVGRKKRGKIFDPNDRNLLQELVDQFFVGISKHAWISNSMKENLRPEVEKFLFEELFATTKRPSLNVDQRLKRTQELVKIDALKEPFKEEHLEDPAYLDILPYLLPGLHKKQKFDAAKRFFSVFPEEMRSRWSKGDFVRVYGQLCETCKPYSKRENLQDKEYNQNSLHKKVSEDFLAGLAQKEIIQETDKPKIKPAIQKFIVAYYFTQRKPREYIQQQFRVTPKARLQTVEDRIALSKSSSSSSSLASREMGRSSGRIFNNLHGAGSDSDSDDSDASSSSSSSSGSSSSRSHGTESDSDSDDSDASSSSSSSSESSSSRSHGTESPPSCDQTITAGVGTAVLGGGAMLVASSSSSAAASGLLISSSKKSSAPASDQTMVMDPEPLKRVFPFPARAGNLIIKYLPQFGEKGNEPKFSACKEAFYKLQKWIGSIKDRKKRAALSDDKFFAVWESQFKSRGFELLEEDRKRMKAVLCYYGFTFMGCFGLNWQAIDQLKEPGSGA